MEASKFFPFWIDKFHTHVLTYATLNDAMTLKFEIERGKSIGGISTAFLLNFNSKFRIGLPFLGFCSSDSLAVLLVLLFTFPCKSRHFVGICRFLSVSLRFGLCFHGGDSVVLLCVQLRKFVCVLAFNSFTLKPCLFCGFLGGDSFLAFLELYRLLCSSPPFCRRLPLCSDYGRLVLSECPYLLLLAC